jgi:two-component system, NtrC family, sensor histidine kinase KinB
MQRNDLLKYTVENTSTAPFKIVVKGREEFFVKEKTAIAREGEQLGTLFTLRNITNFQEKDTAKTNFIAMISHELKTPLASIRMSADLLEHEKIGPINTEQHALISSIKEDSARLLKITGELLNMSQVETGQIQIQLAPTALKGLIDYAVHANKVLAEQKQIGLEIDLEEGLSAVYADAEKAIWVISNLLTNAIRYSGEGSTVRLKAFRADKEVQIEISDNGPGIAPEYQQKIFERYFRVPGSGKGGSGIGLSTSKQMMEAMGGRITLWSEPGKGSSFKVHLPAA